MVAADAVAQSVLDALLPGHGRPTDPAIARQLTTVAAPGTTVVVASSMPIRDLEWFGRPRGDIAVLANRGANGIDGVVSTALGVAAAAVAPVIALIGDLAFLHDSSALVGAARRELDCTFVITDNDGGAIFSFLPQRDALSTDRFEQLFGTPQGADIPALARAHGLQVVEVEDVADLERAIRDADVVHVRTDRSENVEVHRRLNQGIAEAISQSG